MPESPLMLCYVRDGCWAYFSTADPTDVWGDDWNDAPHDSNAGPPYEERAPGMVKVAFTGDLWTVGIGAFGGYVRDRWGWLAVDEINKGEAPWLVRVTYGDPIGHDIEIAAACTLGDFKRMVAMAGGAVYERSEDVR